MNSLAKAIAVLAAIVIAAGSVAALVAPAEARKAVENTIGAVASPDIVSDYIRWGSGYGIRRFQSSVPLTTATTTVCAIQSPAATSSLVSAGVTFTTSSTTASTVHLAKAATAFATTTSLGQGALSANAQGTLVASTTGASPLDPMTVFGPNQWFVVGMAGGTGTFSPVGACHASFEEYGVGF